MSLSQSISEWIIQAHSLSKSRALKHGKGRFPSGDRLGLSTSTLNQAVQATVTVRGFMEKRFFKVRKIYKYKKNCIMVYLYLKKKWILFNSCVIISYLEN